MIGDRENIASMQSDFFRNKYRKMLRYLLLSVSLSVVLIGVIVYLLLFKAPPQYYANTTDGFIFPLTVQNR